MALTRRQPGDILSGSRGTYRLIKEVGGGANESYKALDQQTGKEFLVKIYNAPTKTNPKFDEFLRMQDEHNAILVNIRDITEVLYEHFLIDDNYFCAVIEWISGKSLRDLTDQDFLPLEKKSVIGLATVYVGTLNQIHSLGIIHTDLKPENIYCERQPDIELGWHLKIVDFDSSHIEGYDAPLTVYTPGYESPEYLRNENVLKESDVFTSGIILAGWFTGGGYPYDCGREDTGEKYKKNVLGYKLNSIVFDYIRDEYGKDVADIVRDMLNPNPQKRPKLEDVHMMFIQTLKSVSLPSMIELHDETKDSIFLTVFEKDIVLGRKNFRIFGDASKYSKPEQFQLTL
jgi:serine/threonine protein kinase